MSLPTPSSPGSPANLPILGVPKPKKEDRPYLKHRRERTPAIRRTMRDHAECDKLALLRIHGENPYCFLGSGNAQDWHHILSRGNRFGFKLNAPERKLFSSVFNIAPLGRYPHQLCPILHDPNMELALLAHARKIVNNAVIAGRYELTEIDKGFSLFLEERVIGTRCRGTF